jgi:hypothetical protein
VRALVVMAVTLGGLAAPAGAAGQSWAESPALGLGRSAVATCLRPAGPVRAALLGPLSRSSTATDLIAPAAGGPTLLGRVALGWLDDCPAVAGEPGGNVLVAGAARVGRGRRGPRPARAVRAAAAGPDGSFAAPQELARVPADVGVTLAAAVSSRGDALVAWIEQTPVLGPALALRGARTRLLVARRAPGGAFGAPETVVPEQRLPLGTGRLPLAAGLDAAGRATVAWGLPRAAPSRTSGLADLQAASALPGQPFGPAQRLDDAFLDEDEDLSLAVAGDGRALVAHRGLPGGIEVFERPPGIDPFALAAHFDEGGPPGAQPAVALGAGGAAVVAWRSGAPAFRGAVRASLRAGPGPFPAPVEVAAATGGQVLSLRAASFSAELPRRPEPPVDPDGGRVRALLGGDDRVTLSWVGPRQGGGFDRPPAAHVATGSLSAGLGAPVVPGGPARAADGAAPLLDGAALGLLWTDNRTEGPGARGLEAAVGRGRLHLAREPAAPAPEPSPPSLTVTADRQELHWGQPLRLGVICDRPCDLRAVVLRPRGSVPIAVGTASLARPGRTALRVRPGSGEHIAPRGGGRVRVRVLATVPGGTLPATARLRVAVGRRPVPPLLAPFAVRARRTAAGDVRVTWRTAARADRVNFVVEGRRRRATRSAGPADIVRGGRKRFRARLTGPAAPRVRWVVVRAVHRDPPFRRVAVTVRVSRARAGG